MIIIPFNYPPLMPTLEANFTAEEQETIKNTWDLYMQERLGSMTKRRFISNCKIILELESSKH